MSPQTDKLSINGDHLVLWLHCVGDLPRKAQRQMLSEVRKKLRVKAEGLSDSLELEPDHLCS